MGAASQMTFVDSLDQWIYQIDLNAGQTYEYKGPVFFGDTVHLRLTVDACRPSSKGGKGVVTFKSEVVKQDDTVAIAGSWTVLFRDRPAD